MPVSSKVKKKKKYFIIFLEFSKGLENARQEVAKLQNLYLFVSRTVFGNERTIEILTVLAEIR